MNSVVMIEAGGAPVRTLPKDVQFHPVTDRPLHVDFLRISEHAKVHVDVPIGFVDEEKSKGLKRGGVLNAVRHELELICDAAEIPGRDRDQPRRPRHRQFAAHQRGHPARRASESAITDRDFTIATIVPSSGMSRKRCRRRGCRCRAADVPLVGEEGEGEEAGEEPSEG